MKRVPRSFWFVLVALSLSWSEARAAPWQVAAEEPAADREAALLHRQLDISEVQQWSRVSGAWRPVVVLPAAVYVVNLWSLRCKPCVAEFSLLKNVVASWKKRREVQFLLIADPPGQSSEREVEAFWEQSMAALPDVDPCRASSDGLRNGLDNDTQPLTLLLDEHLVIRQAFIGPIGDRPLARAIERLLRATSAGARAPGTGQPQPIRLSKRASTQ